MKNKGFTLVEVLLVIGIVSLLAMILFPVFAKVQSDARKTVCASNLRQIGIAITIYAQDNDDFFPLGVDPDDKYTNAWQGSAFWPQVQHYPLLPDVLRPYIMNNQIWHCPCDTGFDSVDVRLIGLNPKPDLYSIYGMSYFYRTALCLEQKTTSNLVAYSRKNHNLEYNPAEINVLADPVGNWHGGMMYIDARYMVLMADGHTASMSEASYQTLTGIVLDAPPLR